MSANLQKVKLTVNGKQKEMEVEPRKLFADCLREDLELTGTHVGCEHGVCGACTVIVDGEAVRSCLMFGVQLNGCDVMTVEGLAQDGELHPIQKAFHENHGLQCGFCTPGFLTTTLQLLKDNPDPNEQEIRAALSGNLCRCTGYVNIVSSVKHAAQLLK
jgi:carbon-monoxide dehydrogenase small subunit